jgi:polysaccharide export outer membrane protein
MKFGKTHLIQFGLFLIVFSGFVLAQAPDSGSGQPAPSSSPSQAEGASGHDSSYVIGNGDLLAISVWKEAELTRSIPVRSDGKISMPLVGEIQASGLTPLALEEEISEKLKNFVTTPEVTVVVEQINSKKFNILGQIGKPGSYSLSLASTIMDAIAAAGGFRDFAKKGSVYILRQNADGTQTKINFNYKDFIKGKHPEQNIKLEPRDTIIVP